MERCSHVYNLFCAGTTVKFMRDDITTSDAWLSSLIREDAEAVRQGLDIISDDLAKLAKRLIKEGGVTGIYFSLQNLLGEGMTKDVYDAVLRPEKKRSLPLLTA